MTVFSDRTNDWLRRPAQVVPPPIGIKYFSLILSSNKNKLYILVVYDQWDVRELNVSCSDCCRSSPFRRENLKCCASCLYLETTRRVDRNLLPFLIRRNVFSPRCREGSGGRRHFPPECDKLPANWKMYTFPSDKKNYVFVVLFSVWILRQVVDDLTLVIKSPGVRSQDHIYGSRERTVVRCYCLGQRDEYFCPWCNRPLVHSFIVSRKTY